jgi:hypothetical protein
MDGLDESPVSVVPQYDQEGDAVMSDNENIRTSFEQPRPYDDLAKDESESQPYAQFPPRDISGTDTEERKLPEEPPAPPIFSWLQQTALPDDPQSVRQWQQTEEIRQAEEKAKETEGIEIFRNVHLILPSEQEKPALPEETVKSEEEEFPFGARIYYRNILDRYPEMQPPLAQRFARAIGKGLDGLP